MSSGRALHLANSFEAKCKYVLRIGNMVKTYEADPVATLQDAIAALPADKMLGETLRDLGRHLAHARSWDVNVLDKARKARNFIAHEGADIGHMNSASARRILDRVSLLRTAVTDLTLGDNVVSQWVFGIEEPRAPLPVYLIEAYPQMVDDWVFGHFGELLSTDSPAEQGTDSQLGDAPAVGE